MKQMKRRLTALLLALFQIVSMAAPGSFAAAEGGQEIVTGTVNFVGGKSLFYVYVDGSSEDLSALGANDYIIIRRFNGGNNVAYARIPMSDINSAGYYKVDDSQDFISQSGQVFDDPNAMYKVCVAHIEGETSPDYGVLDYAFTNAKNTLTSGGKQYITSITGEHKGDISIQLNRQTDAFDVGITFQDKDGSAIPAPAVDGNYYLIALDVGPDGDFSAGKVSQRPSNTYWYIKKLEGFAGTATPTVVSIPGFSNVMYEEYSANAGHPIGTAYQDLPPEVKNRIRVRLVHSTREIQTFGNLRQWAGSTEKDVYEAAINGSFAGYTPDAGNGPVADGAVDYQVGFRKKEPVKHTVTIDFDPANGAVTIPGGEYYLLLEATSMDGTRQYYKTVELATNGTATTTITLDEDNATWSNGQALSPNWQSITGTVIRKNSGATITPGPNSPEPGTYTEAFTIGNNSFTYEKTEDRDGSNRLKSIEHKLTLTANPLENALTPAQVLGPGINYGITAGTFDQVGHMETNFATNLYKCSAGNQVNVDPDLGNNTGAIAAAKIEGKMHMNSSRDVALFIDKADANKVDHNTGKTILVESTQSKISESIVNPILNYGKSMSDTLKAKEATYAPTSPNIDLTQFPDGKTIYTDPSEIPNAFSKTGGGLNIKMHPNQTVVFNIPNSDVKVGQIQYTFTDGLSWASDTGRERIAGNTVFNMPNATNVELNEAIGMFLIPRTDSFTKITQSSEGWVITGGTITSGDQSNEWHNRNQNLSKTADADAAFGKKLDGRTPAAGEVFEFEIYRWDENADNDAGDSHWTYYDTIRNDGQSMNYTFKQEKGGHVFKIKEKGKAADTAGNYFYDEMEYYVTVVQMGYNNVVYAAFPEYYTDAARAIERFRNNDISGTASTSRFKGVIDATEDTNSIGSITFQNETKNTQTAHLQAKKIINEWGNATEFSFVLVAGQKDDGQNSPMPADAVNDSGTTYKEAVETNTLNEAGRFTKTVKVEKSTGVEANFGTIEYKDSGTYSYVIYEAIPAKARAIDTKNGNKLLKTTYEENPEYPRYYLDGMEYDNTRVPVTVQVDLSGGSEPAVQYGKDTAKKFAEFTNTYRRATTDLKATKQIAGSRFNFQAGDKWTFTVTAEDAGNAENTDIPMPTPSTITLQPEAGRWIVPIDFGAIEYTIADAGKTYVYTITETDKTGEKVLGTKQVTVTVTEDPATHSLTAIQTAGEGGTSFTNFDAGSTTAKVRKTWVDGNGVPVTSNGKTATVQLIAVKEEKITPPMQTGNLTVYLDGNDDLPAGTSVDVTVNGVTQTLNAGSSWSTTFRNIPAGSRTVTTAVNGDYVTVAPAGTAVTITDGTEHLTLNASYIPPKKDLKVRIDWGSGEKPSGSITATANDGTRVVLNSANNWTGDLHSMTAGQNYTVTLSDLKGVSYTPGSSQSITIANSDSNELVFSGKYNPFTAEIPVEISWNDVPQNVTVTVTAVNANDANDKKTITLSGSETNWTGKFEGLREDANYTITASISGQNAGNASLQPAGSRTVKAGSHAEYIGHYDENNIPDDQKVKLKIYKKSTGQNDNELIYGEEEFRINQPITVTFTVHGWGFSANYRATNGQSGRTAPQNTNNDYTYTTTFTFGTPGDHTIWIESPWGKQAVIGATASQAKKTSSRIRNLFSPDQLIATSGVSDVHFADESPEISIQENLQQLNQIVGNIGAGGYTLVGKPVELNQDNSWQYDWGELPEYYQDEDGTIHKLKYYVIETAATKTSANEYSTNSTTGLTTIKNIYADTTEIKLDGTKTLTGRDMTAGEFSFAISEGTTTVATGTNAKANKGEPGEIDFGTIRYTQDQIGIHTYTVTETTPGGKISQTGNTSFTVKVEVYIDTDGSLKARKTADSETVAFTNEYTDRTEITLTGTKTLTGRDMEAGEFTFVVKDENGKEVATGTNAAAGKETAGDITFTTIRYDQTMVGPHTYTVTETAPGRNVTQTGTKSYTVQVKVEINDQDDKLTATLVNPDQKIAFTNAYNASTTLQLEGTKTLTGRNMEKDEFTFVVKEGETTVATGKNAAANKGEAKEIVFTDIPYTQDSIGVHTYTVTEDESVPGNVEQTGEKKSFTVKVNVYPNTDGSLKAEIVKNESDTIAFTNKYEAETNFTLEGTKTLTGRNMKAEEFSFIVEEDGKRVATGKNAAANKGEAGAINFTQIHYTQVDIGEHTYTITEETPTQANVTRTGAESFTVKVNVSVGPKGDLQAVVTDDSPKVAFVNAYSDKTEITLPGTKTLTGRDMKAEEFTFTVKEGNTTVATGTNAAAGKGTPGAIIFDTIKYDETQVGPHIYTVTEDTPLPGYVKQTGTTSFEVTVEVYIDDQDELQAKIEDGSDTVTFTNEYKDNTDFILTGTKTLTGRPMTAEEFTFVVTENSKEVVTGKNAAAKAGEAGTVTFKDIHYTQDDIGEHTYTVTEQMPLPGNVTQTGTISYIVKVNVYPDETTGKLTAKRTDNGPAIAFTNEYKDNTEIKLHGTKTLTGRTMKAGEFHFVVTEEGETEPAATGKNVGAQSGEAAAIEFTEIAYTQADIGEHTYTVTETEPTQANVELVDDQTTPGSFTVKVNVFVDEAGELQAEVVENVSDTVAFNNTYKDTTEITLSGTKTLTGRAMAENEFSFVVKEGDTTIQTVGNAAAVNGAAGVVAFKPIQYTEANIGEHIYTITEVKPAQVNVEQTGTTSYTVKVNVYVEEDADDAEFGELKAEIVSINPRAEGVPLDEAIAFTNTYADATEITLTGMKTLTGREMKAGEFNFVVKEGDEVVAQGTHDGAEAGKSAAIAFPTIRYTQDQVGTHTYTVTELPAKDNQRNVAVDPTSYTVTVEVEIVNGRLTAKRTDSSTLAFTNAYTDTTSLTLKGTKTLSGRNMAAGEFSFAVEEDGKAVKNKDNETVTGSNAAAKDGAEGIITFKRIDYTQDDIGEHIYTVTETGTLPANVSQTGTTSFTVKVNVYVDENGELQAKEMTAAEGSQKIAFTNEYADTAEITLTGTKKLTGREMKVGEFNFAVLDEDENEAATGTNAGAEAGDTAAIRFTTIRYTQADVGEHEYTVIEKPLTEHQLNVTNKNPDGFKVTVNVYIDDQGELQAEILSISPRAEGVSLNEAIAFTNEYADTASVQLTGTKTLLHHSMAEGDFLFRVTEHEGTPENHVVAKGYNEAAEAGESGDIIFKPITYNEADVGEHIYTITEVTGDSEDYEFPDNVTQTGITSFSVKVNVYVDDVGKLQADIVEKPEDGIAFTNTFEDTAEIVLRGTKILEGRDMKDGEFTFVVMEDGVTKSEGKNIGAYAGEAGEIVFDTIHYDQTDKGEHTYTITEAAPLPPNVAIKENTASSFMVKVKVYVNEQNQLQAEIEEGSDTIAFTNKFADNAAVTLEGTKTLTGRAMKENEFSFVVKEGDTEIQTAGNETATLGENGATGNITFTQINYTEADIGEHIYTITETEPTQANVKQTGKTSFTVKVKVYVEEDKDAQDFGRLKAEIVDSDSEEIKFTNAYTDTTEITLEGTKTLEGREMKAGEFSFVVMEGETKIATVPHDGAEAGKPGAIRFPAIKYDQDDIGEHTYTITEAAPGQAHVTPGKDESFTVAVDVYVDDDGELQAKILSGPDTLAFTNAYAHEAYLTLTGTKTLTGRDMEAGEFKFSVKENGSEVTTGKNAADTTKGTAGAIAFDAIKYSEKDIGEHIYVVTEESPLPNHVRQTGKTSFTVKVKVYVGDNGDLQAKVIEEESQPIAFTNAYADTTAITLDATKALDGREMTAGEFTFEIWEGNELVAEGTHHDGAVTGKTAAVSFPKITYNQDNVGTHTYTVKEKTPGQNHVTQAGTKEYKVVVDIEIVNGELQAKLVSGGKDIAFANEYRDDVVFTLTGSTKTLTGRDMEANEFRFAMKENGVLKATGKNAGAKDGKPGTITFTPIKFEQSDIGEHIYTITEITADADGYKFPANVKQTGTQYFTVKVKVFVDAAGELQAEVVQKDSQTVAFTNKYEDKVRFLLTGTKTLTGRDMKAGEFTFVVKDKDGKEVVTGTQDGAKDGTPGRITFREIEYDQTQVGEHTYTVTEKTDALPGGVSHTDPAQTFKVTVKVYIDGNGELQAVPVANETDDVAFTNVYKATGSTTLEINKALAAGDTWPAGKSVTFKLESTDNGPMPAAEGGDTVTLSGAIKGTFGAIAWTNADRDKTYHYTITETAGFGDEWTASAPVKVTIRVTDDGVGHMNGAVTYDPADSTITNDHVYISTKVTKKEIANGPELPGAHIQVIDSQGKVFAEWDSTKEAHTVKGLVIGEVYKLRETVAPAGYTVTTDITFSVDEQGKVTTGASTTQDSAGNDVILVEDEKTRVTVSKQEIANGPELPGAHIQIIDSQGKVVEEWDSTETAKEIKGLHTGEVYTLHETVAPNGYTIAADTTFTIDEHGNVKAGETTVSDGHIVILDAPTRVTVSKKGVTGSDELKGAQIQLLQKATAAELANPGTVYADAENKLILVDEWTSGPDPYVIEKLLVGVEYTLRETVAPAGYTVAADTTFTVDKNGNVTAGGTEVTGGHILIHDTLTKVTISKKDIEGGEELPGAHMQIIDSNGTPVREWTSGQTPYAIEGLLVGEKYTLRETAAPEGYTVTTDIPFTLNNKGEVSTEGKTSKDAQGKPVILVEDARTRVTVSKKAVNGDKELPGAHIQIIDSQGRIFTEWDSTTEAKEIKGLKTGEVYTLHETVAPGGYTIAADTTFTIDEHGNVKAGNTTVAGGHIVIEDTPIKVSVSKKAIGGSEELENAQIQILRKATADEQNNPATVYEDADNKLILVEKWTSGTTPHAIEGLAAGEEYTLRETVAPDGYTVATDITFTVNDRNEVTTGAKTTTDAQGKPVILVEDALTKVTVSKKAVSGDDELPGATIQIIDSKGKTVKEWISTEKAEEIKGLLVGETYTLHETVAPKGYTVAADTKFTIDKNGNVKAGETAVQGGHIVIRDSLTKVTVSKQDIANGAELPGAHIQIIDNEGRVFKEWDSTGAPYPIEGLHTGREYTLHETVAPNGYTIAADTKFMIDATGKVTSGGTTVQDGHLVINDTLTKVTISKKAIGGSEELAGARLQVIDNTGKVVDEWKSSQTAYAIEGLRTGVTYTLRETVAPDGYTIATDITFSLDEKGEVTATGTTTRDVQGKPVILVEDAPTKVTVSKKAIGGDDELPGATIQIIDSKGNVVREWVSTQKAEEIEGLLAGEKYTLRETIAPHGYTIAADTTFTIDETGTVKAGETTVAGGHLVIRDALTKITVIKKDIESGEELEGAHLQVIDSNGKVVAEWDSAKTAYPIEGLAAGREYILRETAAPTGYTVTADTAFTLDPAGNVVFIGKRSAGNGTTEIEVKDGKSRVSVSKVDIADGEELEGAHIQIIDSQGKVVEEWDSTKETHTIEGLKTGEEYTLRETVAPEGYTIATDTTFTIDKTGKVTSTGTVSDTGVLLVEDAMTKVKVSKTDIADGEELEGATIQIIDSKGKVVTGWVSAKEPHEITGLKTGEEYTLRETVAPEGYTIATDTTFTIDKTGKVTSTGTVTQDGILLVEDAITRVKVSKTDIADGEELEGATIQIIDSKGKVVEEWVSAKEPHEITGLKTGEEYTLRETVAPEGYTIATDTTFTIDETGKVTTTGTITENGILLVEDAITRVKVSKTDITGEEELEGATIQIIDSNGKVVTEWVSAKEPHEITGLKTGEEYTLRETVAPEGYTIATDTTFTIDETGKVTTTGTVTENGVLLVEDAMTTIKVSKTDIADGEELEGAHIQIIDSQGKVVEEWVSAKEPHEITGLKTGEAYTLRETVAPEGYTIATDTTFTIDETGKVTTTGTVIQNGILLVEDAITRVKVSKTDIADGEELEGATIQIINSNGKVVREWVSAKEPHEITGLKTGEEYTLRETVAPEGYTIATDTTFTIDETGKVTTTGTVTENGILLVEDALTTIKVSKTDITGEEELEGATIQIINSNGKVVREWVSAKEPCEITGLKTGEEYTLRETVAPEGYAIAADTKFTIDETGKLTSGGTEVEDGYILIKDDLIRKTGDLVITNTVISDDPADKDKEFEYTIELDDKTINGTYGDVTFEDGVAKITLKDGEKATITDLPVDTKYTVTQKDEDGFTVEKTGDTGTISKDPSQADFVNTKETKTVDLVITNTVISDDPADKDKDFEFTIELEDKTINGTYGDVTFEDGVAKITLKDGESATIKDLPVGTKYTVTETEDNSFQVTQTGETGMIHEGFGQADFINRIERKTRTTSAAVKKAWNDENDRDGVRPLKVTVDLRANGAVIRTIDLTKESHWMAVACDLPEADAEGKTIAYTWTERDPGSGYKLTGSVTKGTLTTLTNSRDPEQTEISFEQKWEDKDNAYGTRPDQIRVQLYEDGEPCGDEVILNAKEGWKHTWTDVKKNSGGRETVYTVRVLDVPDAYRSVTTGDAGSGFVNTSAVERGSLVIRKTFDIEIPEKEEAPEPELRDITVRKVWEDNDNRDGNRPESVTVHLLAGGEKIRTAVLKEENGWKYTFTNLPKTARGKGITYSVTEDPVTDYICKVNGFTIRNIYRPEMTTATVRKVWDDDNDRQGIRPQSIRMMLSNGKTVTLNKANGWQATITGLPKRLNGQEARYTWTEQNVLGYQLQSVSTTDTVTTFTNEVYRLPEIPENMRPKKMPSGTWNVFEGYDIPLGVETIINHVGDCFD